jgi:riboflavin biosynthesis pyrimidine reductase
LLGRFQFLDQTWHEALTDLGLVDEYQLYFQPVVLGHGKPFFARPWPPLRFAASDLIGR